MNPTTIHHHRTTRPCSGTKTSFVSLVAIYLALFAGEVVSHAANGTWTNDASSVWSDSTSWLNGIIANGTDATADFSTLNTTADRTVTLDSARSAGSLLFSGNANAHNWFLNASGGGSLSLVVSSGTPTIAVTNTATINASLTGTAGLTKTGGGTLILGGTNSYVGTTAISNGTVRFPAPSVNATTVPSPVVYMSFDNISGTTVVNDGSGGSVMNGTLTGTAAIVGGGRLGGNCLSIPATVNAGYVAITNSVVLFSSSTNWTVAMWIKTTTAGGTYLYQGNGGWNNTGGANTIFHLNNGGNQAAGAGGNGLDGRGGAVGGVSFGRGWESGSTPVNDGNWHFIVMTCNANNTKVSYVDGNVDAWSEDTWSGLAGGTNVWIGACGETADGVAGLNGLIDEVSIYNRTLGQQEVQTLMAAGTIPSASPLSIAASSTLDLNGRSQIVGGLISSGTVDSTLSGGTPMLNVNTTGASTNSGTIANTAGSMSLAKSGTGSLTLNGSAANTYTGATVVNGGLLVEDFANASSAANLINSSSPLVLGGGTLQVKQKSATTTSQTFGGTTVNPGFSKVVGTQVTSGALTIALGALTQNVGGSADFTPPTGGSITTTTANGNGILGGWATVNGNLNNGVGNTNGDWAVNDGSGNIIAIPYANYTPVSATASSTPSLTGSATQNWISGSTNNAGNFISTLSASATVNSLVQCGDFNVPSGDTLTLGSGGLIMRSVSRWMLNNNAGNSTGTAKLASGLPTGELYVHVPDADAGANNWTIWPAIIDGTVPTTLIKDGPGLLKLGNNNTYTAGTIINGGSLQLGNGAGGGSTGFIRGVVTINPGATLILNRTDAVGYGAGACVSAINVFGGTLSSTSGGNEGFLLNINLMGGTVTSSGGNYVFSPQTPAVYGVNSLASPITSLFSGPIFFNGLGLFNIAQGSTPSGIDLTVSGIIKNSTGITKSGAGTILLSGANTFTGGWTNNAGTVVIANATALGTGAGILGMFGGSISNNAGTSYSVPNAVVLVNAPSFGVNTGDTFTFSGAISGNGSLNKVGGGTLKLSSAETYTANTIISGGALQLTGSGSISSSPNINVGAGATLDVSVINFTLGGSQTLLSSGTVTGSVVTVTGAKIYAGTDGTTGTAAFKTNLTLASGVPCYFDLGTTYNGANDQIVVAGNLTNNNNLIHIKAPSTLVNLDQSSDYVLFTVAGIISSNLAIAPVWDVAPLNSTHFRIVTGANTVTLHYDPSLTAPSGSGTATPATLTRNQSTTISVNVVLGTYPISAITVDASSIGGTSSLSLVQSNSSTVYTNSVVVSSVTAVGPKSLNGTITDTSGFFAAIPISLTVTTANQIWGGGSLTDNNWSSNPNWTSGAAPALAGDSVVFAGSTRLAPNMDTNYSVTGLTFDSTATGFTVGSTGGNILTLTGTGVTNNSTTGQTLNVPVVMSGAQTFNAAAGNLTLSQTITNAGSLVTVSGVSNTVVSGAISGAGGLTKTGNGTLTISSSETYGGATTVSGGAMTVSGAGAILNSPSVTINTSTVNLAGVISNTALDSVGSATGSAVLNIAGGSLQANFNSGQVYNSSLNVSSAAGSVGDIQMSSGTVAVNRQLAVGPTGFGAFSQSGGLTTVGGFIALGGTANGGVINQSGGTISLTGGAATTIGYSVTNSVGVLNLSGTAAFNVTGGGNGVWPGEVGNGTLNVSGNAVLTVTNDGLYLGKANVAANGTVNLLGGVVAVNFVTNGTGTGAFNFNGGTLKANSANPSFVGSAVTTVFNDYSGGALINDGGFPVTFGAPILTVSGYGVTSVPVTSGGSGYIDTPLLIITNISASGSGATAVANVSGGTITSITVTCPGQNYGSSDLLGVTVVGGGGSGAIISTPVLAPNSDGGLTKLGSGTLTLAAGNTYTNATRVLAGNLNLSFTTLATQGNLVISNGTAVVDVSSGNPMTVNNLILLSNANLTLSYGAQGGNPGFTAVPVNYAIATSGTNIINISGSGFTLGQFPLISYTGTPLASISNFKIGSLPVGVSATLVNNTGNTPNPSIDLNITLIGQNLTWEGTAGGNWDVNSTFNWRDINNNAVKYLEYNGNTFGDFVTFDDSLTNDFANPQPTNINVSVALHPSSITENSSLPYSFKGSGSLAGAGALNMNGSGSLMLGISNSMTGGTVLNSGTLVFSNASAIGTGPLTIVSGALDSAIPNLVNGTTNAQNWNGDFTFNGSQNLNLGTGSVTMSANRVLTVNSNILTVGGTVSGGALNLTLTGNGMLAFAGTNKCTGNYSVGEGALAVSGNGSISAANDILIGTSPGLEAAFYQSGSTTVSNSDTGGGAFQLGDATDTAGYYKMTGGTLNLAGEINIGGFSGGAFTFGQLDLLGGTINIPNRAAGTYFLVNRAFAGGEAAVVNVLGGTVQVAGGGSPATSGLNGLAVNWSSASGNADIATVTVGGGGQILTPSLTTKINMGTNFTGLTGNSANVAALNLNSGGLLQTLGFLNGTGNNTNVFVNFNGGTLKAGIAANTTFLTGLGGAYVYGGGATIDDNGLAIVVGQALLTPTGSGISSIPVTLSGSGYIAPPQVIITDLTGVGATAYATIDPNNHMVTGIVVTSPGNGYTSPSVTLSGVAGSGATAGTPVLTANISGGLIKNGSGTLTLNGADTYTGATVVNTGELFVTPAHVATGSLSIANTAAFGVTLSSSTGSVSVASLTLASGTTTLDFTFGVTNGSNPMIISGPLTLNGTCTLRLSGLVNIGTIPLVHYTGTIAGSGSFNPTLVVPRGVVATLSNSVSSSTIYAIVTQTGAGLVWTGSSPVNPNLWDISISTNWMVGASPTVYLQPLVPGDGVAFNDAGSGLVIINTNVSPSSVIISNATTGYTFQGSSHIAGTTGLIKTGPGLVTMNASGNTYTGNSVISNGVYQLGNSTALPTGGNLLISSPAKVDLNGSSPTVSTLSLAGVIDNSSGTASVLTMGGSNSPVTWTGIITNSGSGGTSFIKNGTNGTTVTINTANYLASTAASEFNSGSLLITNGGALYMSGGGEFWVAQGANNTATSTVDGGTLVTSNNWMVIGRGSSTANGTLIVNHGLVQKAGANNLVVGSLGATGNLVVNGGQVLNSGNLWLGEGSTASGTLHLNGGLIQATQIRGNNSGGLPATSAAYFNGGTLQASASSADFISTPTTPYISGGGLVLDDGGNTVTIVTEALQEDPASTGGGLIKKGAGTLYLDAANTYTGTTVVTNGTLAGAGSISAAVVVAPGGTIGAGDAAARGVLTINNNLTVQGKASLRIDKTLGVLTSDLVTGLGTVTYGGSLVIANTTSDATPLASGDVFTMFNAITHVGNFTNIVGSPGAGLNYSFTNGVLSVVAGIASYPTNITATVSGNTLSLSWPATHLGWFLQVQTNHLAAGLSSNTNDWMSVPGSAGIDQTNIIINPALPTEFYRLRHP